MDSGTTADAYYTAFAAAVRHACEEVDRLDGVGIGLPGQVDPTEKILLSSPGGFHDSDPVARKLAELLAIDPEVCEKMAGDRDSSRVIENAPDAREGLERVISSKILIDNDVRCATRFLISRTRPGADQWRNFACVFIGNGVGAGLVLNGAVYYGSSFSAGEIGHLTCHIGSHVDLNGAQWTPPECLCDAHGIHWEALVGAEGLLSMAQAIDSDAYARFADLLESDGKGYVTPEDIAALALATEAPRAATTRHDAVGLAARDKRTTAYVHLLVDQYATFVAIGLANMANSLNLDHIVLAGGVMDGFWPIRRFQRKLKQQFAEYSLAAACRTLRFEHDAQAGSVWAWRGSALLFLDPTYIRLFPHLLAP